MKRFRLTNIALFLAIFVTASNISPTAAFAAMSPEQRSLLQSGINYFNSDETPDVCASRGVAGAGDIKLTGDNNRAKVFNFFIQKGLTEIEAGGIFGNLAVESGINISPFAEEKLGQDSGGKGIAQWTATRRVSFEKAAKGAGIITRQAVYNALPADQKPIEEDKALSFNLNYLWSEATERGDLEKLRTEGTTLPNAVSSWLRWYERASIPHLDDRIERGQNAIDEFGSSAPVSPTASPAATTPSNGCPPTNNANSNRIVEIALSQEGILESSNECKKYFRTGGNCATPWCAAFATWVYAEAGYQTTKSNLAKGVGKWFFDNKFFFRWQEPYTVQPGDIFVKGRGSSGTSWEGTGHIGIVVAVDGFSMTTIEGNSSNKVKKNTYADYRKIPSLIGFGRYVDKNSVQPTPGFNPVTGAGGEYDSNEEE